MVSVRAVVAAALLAVAAAAATVRSAAATSYSHAVCVTTTTKCCYTPYVCGVVIKKTTSKGQYDCSHKVVKKVEVPCNHYGGGGIHIISHRTYVAPHYVRKCYTQQHVVVAKTCYKDTAVLKYFAKICYKEACHHPTVSGTKPSDGVVGSGVDEHTVHGDPEGYFKKLYGY